MPLPLEDVVSSFVIHGQLVEVAPFKCGHINETYLSTWKTAKGVQRYIHQRINHLVFKDVPRLMENIVRVTDHVRSAIRMRKLESSYTTLEIIPTKAGSSYLEAEGPTYWRTYDFIENSESFDVSPDLVRAHEAARTFGCFESLLQDLSTAELHETIPRFQDTSYRYEALDKALLEDKSKRAEAVGSEIEFALSRRALGMAVVEATHACEVPLRPTHGDPKINNVLFSKTTGKGVAIVDLDTCMPGTILYDFGDLIRSAAVPSAEDEVDLGKVFLEPQLCEALVRGFFEGSGDFFTVRERELLPLAPRIIALTLAVRFLTDYLNGDVYFKTRRPAHNLDRCRAQFQIVRSMEKQEMFMRKVVEEGFRG